MHLRRLILIVFLIFSFQANAEEKSMTLNLNDADIRAFISTVSEMTGKNFIIDPRVKGRVTVVFSTPTTPDNIYEIFLSVLKVHGYSAVPSGDAIKIIPSAGAKQDNIPTILEEKLSVSEKTLTQVIQVNHADATQLATILRPLLPQHAHIAAHTSSNTLVIVDTASNVNRIVNIIHRIDQANNFGVEIIKLKYAQADTLVQTLNKLVQPSKVKGKQPGQSQSVSADERTNSLILNGDPSWRANIKSIVTQLDQPVQNEGNTEVIYLKYANAKELSEVLRGVGDKMIKSDGKNKKQGSAALFDVQADESTNALVLTAPPILMQSLKGVIDKLDVRREQVHIEAIIVEVGDDKSMDLGVEWQTSATSDGYQGTSYFPDSGASAGLSIGGSGLNLGFFSSGDLRAVLKTFAQDTDANILSTPSLVTLDNEEASIIVGENVPFVTGQYTNSDAASATNPFQTIERQDVGIKLTVTPHINEGETIELKIEQEVSDVDESTKDSEAGITTKKRNIKTTVLVDNGEVIVLGGLMSNDLSETDQKVPLLGDIPILGYLFSRKSTVYNKKNLMVFLRPRILRDKISNRELANERYSQIRYRQQEKWKDGIQLMPGEEPPLLPDRDFNKFDDSATPAPVTEIDISGHE
jgi:general secretion pathway protein D